MSRLWLPLVFLCLSPAPALGQTAVHPSVRAILEKGEQWAVIRKEKCPEPGEDEEIIVCADPEADQDQRVFKGQGESGSQIIPGEAVSATKAAGCIGSYPACAHRLHKVVGIGFGNVPEWPPDLEEVYSGLPEPDMIYIDGKPPETLPES